MEQCALCLNEAMVLGTPINSGVTVLAPLALPLIIFMQEPKAEKSSTKRIAPLQPSLREAVEWRPIYAILFIGDHVVKI